MSLLSTAVLFWFAVLKPRRPAFGLGVLLIFALALQGSILGALLAWGVWALYSVL